MQHTAAQQQGSAISQPVRSSCLLPMASRYAFQPALLSSQSRRCVGRLQQQQRAVAPTTAHLTAACSSLRPLQPRRCRHDARQHRICKAAGPEQQPGAAAGSGSTPDQADSSTTPAYAQDAAASTSSSSQPAAAAVVDASAAAATAGAGPLTVEAVQSDPAATIDAIQRLTRSAQDDATPASTTSTSAAAAAGSDTTSSSSGASDQQQQEQQGALDAFVAAVAKAWAGAQVQWQSAVGLLAAALAAVKASLGKFPAWVAAQKLQKLQEAADAAPTDAPKQAAYLAALNSNAHPREVLSRVESKSFASSPGVVVEYLKALVATERLNEYADPSSSSSSGSRVGLGPTPAPGQDHRSLLVLLQELQGLAGGTGEVAEAAPGSSLRRPLHVVLQGPGIAKASKVAGPFRALWNLVGILTLLMVVSAAWLVGSQALRSAAAGTLGISSGVMTSAAAAPSAAAPSAAGASSSAGPAIEPKEYKREEMPEKSIKRFSDVLGCDESKAELEEVVEFLKEPTKFTRLGAKLPSGVLLTGPPGTGKTLLARAVAGEAGVPFFYRAGSEFEELYVGVGSRRMRALFAAAKKKAPCIVFIDEIDAIGGNRKHWENHTRKTLNQLLVEMDGFEANEGVIVMAATNLPETLDPALKRPGRFDRQVAVPLPDVKGRADILGHYLKDKPVAPGLDTALLARQTSGMSGADLANLVNEAALLAAKLGADAIAPSMVDYAYDKVLMGVERKSAVRSPEALKRTAYHEGGHALVALAVPGASPVHKATIVPRGHALGMVTQVGREDEFSINRQQMVARILVSMGGTVAEELVFGRDQVSSGATDDLRQATNMARHMVMQCGLNDAVGPVFIEDGDMKGLSEGLRQQVDEEVRGILMSARSQVKVLLTERLDQLHALAGALLEHETLNATQIKAVLAGEKLAPALLPLQDSSTQPDAAAAAAAAADGVAAGATLEEQ